jgi:hypothetical protein
MDSIEKKEMCIKVIGEPIQEGMVQSATVGPDENGIYNTIYMGVGQWDAPNILVAYNVDTKRIKQYSIDQGPVNQWCGAWGIFCASDGCIYVGTYFGAHILKFDPKTQCYEDLGQASPKASQRESYVYSFAEDENKNIYGTTYPEAGLVKIDLETKKKEYLGGFDAPLLRYARSAIFYQGRLYCVLGTAETKIGVFDPKTGRKALLDVPGVAASADVVLIKRNGKLYGIDILTKDLWYLEKDQFTPIAIPLDLLERDRIYQKHQKEIPDVLAKSDCLFLESTYRWYQPFPEEPKKLTGQRSLLCITDREIYLVKEDGLLEKHEFSVSSRGAILYMVDEGPSGKIVGSSMLPLRMFCYDPKTDQLNNLGNPSNVNAQIYAFACKDSYMYIASYQKCVISVYDVQKPWHLGMTKEDNPRIIGRIGHNQCRPCAVKIGEDDKVYFASVADYGMQGGALTQYDPVKDAFKVWENIASKQSLKTLAVMKGTGLLACGTSNQTGGGAPGVREIPYVLFFDPEKETIDHTYMPCEEYYREIAVLKQFDGKLYGITTHGVFFVYDPGTRKETMNVKLPIEGINNNSMDVTNNHVIVGVGNNRLFRYDLETSDFRILTEVPLWRYGFVISNDMIYGIAGSKLFTYPLEK